MTPAQYCQERTSGFVPVLVSYKGRNNDICSAAAKAILNAVPGILLSGVPRSRTHDLLAHGLQGTTVAILPQHQLDRAFVSVRGTLALAAMALGVSTASAPGESSIDMSKIWTSAAHLAVRLSQAIIAVPRWREHQWFVLGGAIAMPAMLAWERAMAEAGLALAIPADLKDFTHGRYISALQQGRAAFIVLSDNENEQLANITVQRFSQACPVVKSTAEGAWREILLQHLITAFVAMGNLATSVDIDIKKPPKPEIASCWTNWGKIQLISAT
jgi:hypothetical protein